MIDPLIDPVQNNQVVEVPILSNIKEIGSFANNFTPNNQISNFQFRKLSFDDILNFHTNLTSLDINKTNSKSFLNIPLTLEYPVLSFLQYWNNIKDKVIVLEKDNLFLILPYLTRFDENYKFRIQKKLKNHKKVRHGVLLTLTIDPALVNHDPIQALLQIWDKWNGLISFLRSRHGKLEYYISLEFTKNHYPHLHIIFVGKKWVEKQSIISQWWNAHGMGKIVFIEKIKKRINALKYVLKYITKQQRNIIDMALLWWTNKRGWNRSHFISNDYVDLGSKESWYFNPDKYKFLGVFSKAIFLGLPRFEDIAIFPVVIEQGISKYLENDISWRLQNQNGNFHDN